MFGGYLEKKFDIILDYRKKTNIPNSKSHGMTNIPVIYQLSVIRRVVYYISVSMIKEKL